jgi:hypothetical protein
MKELVDKEVVIIDKQEYVKVLIERCTSATLIGEIIKETT